MPEHTSAVEALRAALRDRDVLATLREITDKGEASGDLSATKAAKMRGTIEAIEREMDEADQ
jgi:hypothetical protein